MGLMLKVVIAVVVIVGVVAAFAETNGFGTGAVTRYFYTTSYAPSGTSVTLSAVEPNGQLTTNATYKVGDPFNLFVSESSPANPIAVHEVFNGTVYLDHSWTSANGNTYTITDTAHANDAGDSLPCYVVVAFDNNQQAISNTIYVTIHN
jgi:hypothetical protein